MQIEINKGQPCSFFIARVGSNVGKPMLSPYTANNSYAVISNDPDVDFAKVHCLYRAGYFNKYAYGTCQPSITLKVIHTVVGLADNMDQEQLKGLATVLEFERQLKAKLAELEKSINCLALGIVGKSKQVKCGFCDASSDSLAPKAHL